LGTTVTAAVAWLNDELMSFSHTNDSSATVNERGPSAGPSEIELTAVISMNETTIWSRVDGSFLASTSVVVSKLYAIRYHHSLPYVSRYRNNSDRAVMS
jgi:hypothetical protein